MEEIKSIFEADLGAVCMQIGANLTLEYNGLEFKLTSENLKEMKEKGVPTNIYGCIVYGLIKSGKTEEECQAFLKEAAEKDEYPSFGFEAPDERGLNITTPDAAPELDKLVKAVEGNQNT